MRQLAISKENRAWIYVPMWFNSGKIKSNTRCSWGRLKRSSFSAWSSKNTATSSGVGRATAISSRLSISVLLSIRSGKKPCFSTAGSMYSTITLRNKNSRRGRLGKQRTFIERHWSLREWPALITIGRYLWLYRYTLRKWEITWTPLTWDAILKPLYRWLTNLEIAEHSSTNFLQEENWTIRGRYSRTGSKPPSLYPALISSESSNSLTRLSKTWGRAC